MADTPKSKISPMYADSNFRELYNFVSELNSIMHNDGLTTERAYQKMIATASEDEEKKYAAMHRMLKACGLISESGKVCTKSEFVDEVQKLKLDLLDKQTEKQKAHDKQLKELNQTKSALTTARLKRNWGLFRKWGAVAFGVTAVVAACLLLPAVASVVAGAIGGAASIGAAVGTAIVAGVVGYGAYHFTKWFVKKNFLEGSELVAKFDHKVRELKADKNKEDAKYKEAQKELQLVKTQIADISSLEGTLDASDAAKTNALAYEYANIDLFNEGERDSYNAVVEQYKAQITDAKTVKDIEDAKKWLVTNTDKFMSKTNASYIETLITGRTTYKTTGTGDMRDPERTAVETREDERIARLTDLKTTFSRSELEKLDAEIKDETYATKEDIKKAIEEESKLFVGGVDETLIRAFEDKFVPTPETKAISKEDLKGLVKDFSTEMSKKYWTLGDVVTEYKAKAGASNVAQYAYEEYILQLGKKLEGSTKCIAKVADAKIEDIIKSAIGEVPAISLEEQSKNPAFIAETTIRSHYDPNGVKGLTKATKEKNRQAIEDKIKEFVQKVSEEVSEGKIEPKKIATAVKDFINNNILPNMIRSAGNKIETPTEAGKTDKKVYSYKSYDSKGHRKFADIVRNNKDLERYFTTEGELTDDISSEQVKFAMLQLKAEFLRKGEIDPERVKHFVDFAKAHAPVKTPAVTSLVDETDDETVDDETKKHKKPGKDSDRIKSGTSEDEEDESDDDRER